MTEGPQLQVQNCPWWALKGLHWGCRRWERRLSLHTAASGPTAIWTIDLLPVSIVTASQVNVEHQSAPYAGS